MKKIDSIVVSTKEPSTDNLWLKDNTLHNYHNGSWKPIEASKEGILTIPENPEEGQMPTVNSDGKVIWSITHNTDAEAIRKDLEKNKEDVNQLKISVEEARLSLFIDMWNTAAKKYGEYNIAAAPNAAKPFHLYDMWLSYEEALDTYTQWISLAYPPAGPNNTVKALLPININSSGYGNYLDEQCKFGGASNLEVVAFSGYRIYFIKNEYTFLDCSKLRSVLGPIVFNVAATTVFQGCSSLKDITIWELHKNINFAFSPLLSLDSVSFMVQHATNDSPITITVHPDVYAKLTGDTTNAAAAALTPEELAQWQQVLTDALQKEIQFTTI